ncbi:N-acetyl-gamma-glutamyl-phosphate reductase [Venatoribacter cucullus]|uniref:N-acetyl-gamma-glutamyl-phosphate reductase n=1 Tax=Venatoribacter cucullus TaxID=2661630 RepID=UPI00223F3987|nr:N-acetyl-gamma-glutamyl-phosphate reductase [Venatoribacter cucullus]UZK04537.1 N-acetyl-gamma-glutamyl-phosphate reductase [Venatoribacter cucullus]
MIKVGIVGGTGYTGVELLRILVNHPDVELKVITSRSEEGVRVADMFPNLRGHTDLQFSVPDVQKLGECDVVFFATPHGVAHAMAEEILHTGARVIDLSADFRLQDADEWAQWYGQPHGAPGILPQAVYGLPEVNREQIKNARLIAVPGCYPTSVQLGLLPLLENNLLSEQMLIADCKSGVSGAGRGASVGSLLCEASESMMAYAVKGHRHLPEIRQGLKRAAGKDVQLTFVPHLTPMIRGIHSTLYANAPGLNQDKLQALYEQRYANEPFVDVMPAGSHPATRSVKGSNVCRIAVHYHAATGQIIVLSVIDNLVKGASGQAVQNMNIMFGLAEKAGLQQVALLP